MESNGNRMSSGLWTGPHLFFSHAPNQIELTVLIGVFFGIRTSFLTPNLESMAPWGSLGSFLSFDFCYVWNHHQLPSQTIPKFYLFAFILTASSHFFKSQSMVVTCTSLNSFCCILILWFLFYGELEVEIWVKIVRRIAYTCRHWNKDLS